MMFPLIAAPHSKRMIMMTPRLAGALPAAKKAAFVGSFSTQQVQAKVENIECVLKQKKWADIMDEVKEIRALLNEFKTNKTVHVPDAGYEEQVASDIQGAVFGDNARSPMHDDVFAFVHGLKADVKGKLYSAAH